MGSMFKQEILGTDAIKNAIDGHGGRLRDVEFDRLMQDSLEEVKKLSEEISETDAEQKWEVSDYTFAILCFGTLASLVGAIIYDIMT